MTGESLGTVISVRGEAQRTVEPDSAVLTCVITSTRLAKPDALKAAADALNHLRDALDVLGGAPLTAETGRSMLTWSAHSTRTYVERELQAKTGRHEPTGQVVASVELNLVVRDFGLLERLGAALAAHGDLHVVHVAWLVDDDNPTWPALRAEAIRAAVQQARHYAAALGGSLSRIEQLADAGLLGEIHEIRPVQAAAAAHGLARGDSGDAPSLDPVPQTIAAAIDARFIADAMSIDDT